MEARGEVENGKDDCGNEILAREPGVAKAATVDDDPKDDDEDDDDDDDDEEVKEEEETWWRFTSLSANRPSKTSASATTSPIACKCAASALR
jgi:hypothetical protein